MQWDKNDSETEAWRQQVLEFVRRYVYLKREGFFEKMPRFPDLVEYLPEGEQIVNWLVDELHVEADEAREAYNRTMFNGSENRFRLEFRV